MFAMQFRSYRPMPGKEDWKDTIAESLTKTELFRLLLLYLAENRGLRGSL